MNLKDLRDLLQQLLDLIDSGQVSILPNTPPDPGILPNTPPDPGVKSSCHPDRLIDPFQ